MEWVGAGRQVLGALLPDVGTTPRENDDTIRLQLFEAVTMLLERASENGPLVVIMEDIHWVTVHSPRAPIPGPRLAEAR